MGALKPINNDTVDVSIDWLYRSKRRSSKSGRSRSNSNPAIRRSSYGNSESVIKEESVEVEADGLTMQKKQPRNQLEEGGEQKRRGRSATFSSGDFKKNESLGERSKRSLFGSIFRRASHSSGSASSSSNVSTHITAPSTAGSSPEPSRSGYEPLSDEGSPSEAKRYGPIDPLEKLQNISIKRVAFAVDRFDNDPPQQLPSRCPRQGNVLVPEDMISEAPTISLGITNNGTMTTKEPRYTRESREYKLALENQKRLLKESAKHQHEAHIAAKHIENEVLSSKNSGGSPLPQLNLFNSSKFRGKQEDMVPVSDNRVANLSIDKPVLADEHPFLKEGDSDGSSDSEVTLDVVYTRCCHLREILPLPSTLKQVKGKTAPLHLLKFLNPKPTLVDMLSFCDFISIAQVHTVVFDKINLTTEMFQILITSLARSKDLEKLSLRNVVINKEGWCLLCKFLMTNKSITRLDISQTRTRSDVSEAYNRDQMDWPLFTQVLRRRKGNPLEELLLNGIRFDRLPTDHFSQLIDAFGEQSGRELGLRLGVAASEINLECMKSLLLWMSNYDVQGVDFAYNDLSSYVKPIANALSSLNYDRLEYVTLNNCYIASGSDLGLLIKCLSALPNLKFLDISNLPQCFPDAVAFLHRNLPKFLRLSRINLDGNGLGFKNLSMLCTIFSKCHSLKHVSMQSQAITLQKNQEPLETECSQFTKNALASNLLALVKNSPNLVNVDVDYDEIPDDIKSRIALTLMQNMNRNMDSNFQVDDISRQDELLFDGSLLAETVETILERLDKKSYVETDATKRYLTKKYFEQTQIVHGKIQTTIDKMFDKKKYGELPLTEKENLLRLVLLEKNLTNVLDIFASLPDLSLLAKSPNLRLQNQQPSSLKHFGSDDVLEIPANSETASRPHLVATDSGKTIDVATGKPVLFKRSSSTSLYSKRQEQEEGELHKWGFYMQQHNSIYPQSELSQTLQGSTDAKQRPSARRDFPALGKRLISPKVPSGSELREAIIKAKGIDSINDLISNVEADRSTLENIYGKPINIDDPRKSSVDAVGSSAPGSGHDINIANQGDAETVQETYDKLLNKYSRERSP